MERSRAIGHVRARGLLVSNADPTASASTAAAAAAAAAAGGAGAGAGAGTSPVAISGDPPGIARSTSTATVGSRKRGGSPAPSTGEAAAAGHSASAVPALSAGGANQQQNAPGIDLKIKLDWIERELGSGGDGAVMLPPGVKKKLQTLVQRTLANQVASSALVSQTALLPPISNSGQQTGLMPSASAGALAVQQLQQQQQMLQAQPSGDLLNSLSKVIAAFKSTNLQEFITRQERIWTNLGNDLPFESQKSLPRIVVARPSGNWVIQRVLICAAGLDSVNERELLVRQVFPSLRERLRPLKVHLQECDLRRGVNTDTSTEEGLKVSMAEIERLFEETRQPFCLAILGEKYGWIPSSDLISEDFQKRYNWVEGWSLLAQQILYSMFLCRNPNAFFLFRDPEFLESPQFKELPLRERSQYLDYEWNNDLNQLTDFRDQQSLGKLTSLKRAIRKRFFPTGQVVDTYPCTFGGVDNHGRIIISGLERFADRVITFLMNALTTQYPLDPEAVEDVNVFHRDIHAVALTHELANSLLPARLDGPRKQLLRNLQRHALDPHKTQALLITGPSGCGKSTIIAAFASICLAMRGNEVSVFYHKVGCAHVASTVHGLIDRANYELSTVFNLRKDHTITFDQACKSFVSHLERVASVTRIIILVDGIDEFTDMDLAMSMRWLPRIGNFRNVIYVLSCTPGSPMYTALMTKGVKEVAVPPLDPREQRFMVANRLISSGHKVPPQIVFSGNFSPIYLRLVSAWLQLNELETASKQGLFGNPDLVSGAAAAAQGNSNTGAASSAAASAANQGNSGSSSNHNSGSGGTIADKQNAAASTAGNISGSNNNNNNSSNNSNNSNNNNNANNASQLNAEDDPRVTFISPKDAQSARADIPRVPETLSELLSAILELLERRHSQRLVCDLLCLLSLARYGLYEHELQELLAGSDGNPLPSYPWALILRDLKHLVSLGGVPGQSSLQLSHPDIAHEILRLYPDQSAKYHERLAALFRLASTRLPHIVNFPDYPREYLEMMHHTSRAGATSRMLVAVRARPFAKKGNRFDKQTMTMKGNSTILRSPVTRRTTAYEFDFSLWSHDRASDERPYCTGTTLFNLFGIPIINDALAGRCSSFFAFGQAGSGRTYSLFGPEDSDFKVRRDHGLVWLLCKGLFDRIEYLRRIEYPHIPHLAIAVLGITGHAITDLSKTNVATPVNFNSEGLDIPTVEYTAVEDFDSLINVISSGVRRRYISEKSHSASNRFSTSHLLLTIMVTDRGRRTPIHICETAASNCLSRAENRSKETANDPEQENARSALLALQRCMECLASGERPPVELSLLTMMTRSAFESTAPPSPSFTGGYLIGSDMFNTLRNKTKPQGADGDPATPDAKTSAEPGSDAAAGAADAASSPPVSKRGAFLSPAPPPPMNKQRSNSSLRSKNGSDSSSPRMSKANMLEKSGSSFNVHPSSPEPPPAPVYPPAAVLFVTVHAGEENYAEIHQSLEYARPIKHGEHGDRLQYRKNLLATAAAAQAAAAQAAAEAQHQQLLLQQQQQLQQQQLADTELEGAAAAGAEGSGATATAAPAAATTTAAAAGTEGAGPVDHSHLAPPDGAPFASSSSSAEHGSGSTKDLHQAATDSFAGGHSSSSGGGVLSGGGGGGGTGDPSLPKSTSIHIDIPPANPRSGENTGAVSKVPSEEKIMSPSARRRGLVSSHHGGLPYGDEKMLERALGARAVIGAFLDNPEFISIRDKIWELDNRLRSIGKVGWTELRDARNDPSLTQEQALLACEAFLHDGVPSLTAALKHLQSPDAHKFVEQLLAVGYDGYTGKRIRSAIKASGNFNPADAGSNVALQAICAWLSGVIAFSRRWAALLETCAKDAPTVARVPDMASTLFSLLRSRITNLDLSGQNLGDIHASVVAEFLMRSPRILSVDLRNNQISDDGLVSLSQAVSVVDSLLTLDVRGNTNTALGAFAMAELYKERPNMAIHFDVTRVWLVSEEPSALEVARREARAMLETAELAFSLLQGTSDDRLVSELGSHRKHHCTRCGCDFNENGAHWAVEIVLKYHKLREAPWGKSPPVNKLLDRDELSRDEHLQVFVSSEDEARFCLIADLCEQPGQEKRAGQSGPSFTPRGQDPRAIAPPGGASPGTTTMRPAGGRKIKLAPVEEVVGSNTLAEVQLSKTAKARELLAAVTTNNSGPLQPNEKRSGSIAGSISSPSHLIYNATDELVVRQGLGDEGMLALSEFLRVNNTITRLVLHRHGIGDAGIKCLANALEENTTISELYLKGNFVTDVGCTALLRAVRSKRIVRLIDLQGNPLRPRGWADMFVTFALPGYVDSLPSHLEQALLSCTNLAIALLRAVFKFEKVPDCKVCLAAASTAEKMRGALSRVRLAAIANAEEKAQKEKDAKPRITRTNSNASTAERERERRENAKERRNAQNQQRRLLVINTDSEAIMVSEFIKKNVGLVTCIRIMNSVSSVGGEALGDALANYNTGVKFIHCSRRNPPVTLQVRQLSLMRKLDLTNGGISDGMGVLLAKLLRNNDVCGSLDLRHNELTDASGRAIAETISRNSTLQEIYISNNYMGMDTALALAATCEKKIAHKASVMLTDGVMIPLGGGIASQIVMRSCGMTALDAVILAGYLKYNRSVTFLDLSENPLEDIGTKAIAAALADNTTITQIDLAHCGVGHAAATLFAKAAESVKSQHGAISSFAPLSVRTEKQFIPIRSPGTKYVTFADQFVFTNIEFTMFCGFLRTTKELVALEIDKNLTPGILDQFPEQVLTALTRQNPNLSRVNISGTPIPVESLRGAPTGTLGSGGSSGGGGGGNNAASTGNRSIVVTSQRGLHRVDIVLIAAFVQINASATSLELSNVQLGRNISCLEPIIVPAPNVPVRLTRLLLAQNGLNGDDATVLAGMLMRNNSIKTLDLSMNKIEDQGAIAFGQLIASTTTLAFLDLSQNEIRNPGAEAIAAGIEANRRGSASLANISLIGNKFSEQGQSALQNSLFASGMTANSKLTMRISLAGPLLSSQAEHSGSDRYIFGGANNNAAKGVADEFYREKEAGKKIRFNVDAFVAQNQALGPKP